MPRNILVEDEVLDTIAFQAGFISGYLMGCIVTGHKTSNTPVVLGNPSDRHPQSSLKLGLRGYTEICLPCLVVIAVIFLAQSNRSQEMPKLAHTLWISMLLIKPPSIR